MGQQQASSWPVQGGTCSHTACKCAKCRMRPWGSAGALHEMHRVGPVLRCKRGRGTLPACSAAPRKEIAAGTKGGPVHGMAPQRAAMPAAYCELEALRSLMIQVHSVAPPCLSSMSGVGFVSLWRTRTPPGRVQAPLTALGLACRRCRSLKAREPLLLRVQQ